jgi:ankyrin repeat protein
LNSGCDPNVRCKSGNTALWWATTNGFPEIVRLMINSGADLNAKSVRYSETALMRAITNASPGLNHSRRQRAVLEILLEQDNDLSLTDDSGNQPLKLAAWNGDLESVRLLVHKGAEIDHRDNEGMTACMWAAHQGHAEVLMFLLEKGANVNARNNYGHTMLSLAVQQKDRAVLDVLVEYRAKGISELLMK